MVKSYSNSATLVSAVGYVRRSTNKQEKSLRDQKTEIQRYAHANGYKIVRWYEDDAISGDATEQRAGFQDMHTTACNGRDFDVIIVWDQDRFGRFSPLEASYWTFPLAKAGVKLVTVSQGLVDWNDFTQWLTYSVNQHGKHEFLKDLSRNVARGQLANAQKGYLCGQRAPYGYDRMFVDENGKHIQRVRNGEQHPKLRSWHAILVPSDDPTKVDTLQWLFTTYAETDTGVRKLADDLNARGIPGPAGRGWYGATIREILKNQNYVGTYTWAKRREGKYHSVAGTKIKPRDPAEVTLSHAGKPIAVDNPQDAWIVTENAHEALVDRDTFDRVQAKLERRKKNGGCSYRTHTKRNGDAYILTGLVFCGHCGEKMHGATGSRKKNGKTYRYPKYLCSTYNRSGKNNPHGCGCHSVHQGELVNVLVRKLRELVTPVHGRLEDIVRCKLTDRTKPDAKRLTSLRKRMTDLDGTIDRAADRLMSAPEDLMDLLAPKLTAMKLERQRVQEDIKTAESAAQPIDVESETKAVVARLRTLADELDKSDPARVRELFQRMVKRVDLRFTHIQRGKRMECPFDRGEILLNPAMYSCVSRGDRI